jgi:hypothetical protein
VVVVRVVTVVAAAPAEMAQPAMQVLRVKLHPARPPEVRGQAPWAEATGTKTRAQRRKAEMAEMVLLVVMDRSNRLRTIQRS